jgi:hypothetical protein
MIMRLLKLGSVMCVFSLALTPVFAGDNDAKKEYKTPTPEELVQRYDKNGDGKLSRSEKKKAVKGERVRRFDADGNGKLDSKEKRKMKNVLTKEARLEKEVDSYMKRLDVITRDGLIDDEEQERASKMGRKGRRAWGGGDSMRWLRDADKNDDGDIDRKELREALKAKDNNDEGDWRKKAKDWKKNRDEREKREREEREKRKKDGDKKDGDKKDGDKKDGDKKEGDKKEGDKKDTGNSP